MLCNRHRRVTQMTTAAIRRFAIPTPEELIGRARGMVPEIRSLAEETERNRNVFPHIIDKIRDAELLRTCRPKEFGGFEYDGEVALKIALTISAACPSTGWAVNGAVSNGRSLGHFPIEAQREIWGSDEDPFTCACFAPTGTAVPVDGGYRLSGTWSFASGCDRSSWAKLGAFVTPPSVTPPYEGAFFLLRSAIARSSTIGSSAASPAPAARTLSYATPLCRRTGSCYSPTRGPEQHRAPAITAIRSTACRFSFTAPPCSPRPRWAPPEARSTAIWK